MLSPYNVLDLSEEGALLCGQILADLGADVIQVEPVSGSPTRRLGPFAKDQQDPENSLFWWAYARNKRGIRLDLDAARDRAALLELVRSADVWIESDPPGKMVQRGFGYPELSRVNRRWSTSRSHLSDRRGPKRTTSRPISLSLRRAARSI